MRLIALDLVRFFAAFSVVIYHYTYSYESNSFTTLSEFTKFGHLDVPLFFIISGYVIALSVTSRSAFEFAISRFVRLYPAFWVGIAFTVLVVSVRGENQYSIGQIAASLTMLGKYLGYENIDYVYWIVQEELKFLRVCVFASTLRGL